MRRHLGLMIVLLAGFAVYLAMLEPFPVRAYRRIQIGMTLDEVIAAVGAPPRDCPIELKLFINYPLFPDAIAVGPTVCKTGTDPADVPPFSILETWDWHRYRIHVMFDLKGAAIRTELIEMPMQSLLNRVRAWLGI